MLGGGSHDTMIGVGLIFAGLVFFTLSFMMFLDRGFLLIGNFSFLMGVCSLIGVRGTFAFFMKPSKRKFSAAYFGGLIIVIIGMPFCTVAGFCLQVAGMFLLFRSFFKTAFAYLQTLPYIGSFLRDTPLIHKFVNAISTSGSQNKSGSSKKFEV